MNDLYWKYETSIGDETCISIRAGASVSKTLFDKYFTNFVCKFSDRIKLIDICFEKFIDGSHCINILLSGRQYVDFDGKK